MNDEENDDSDSIEDYLDFDASRINEGKVEFRLDRKTATENDVTAEVSLVVDGEVYRTEEFEDTEDVQAFELDENELRSEFGEKRITIDLRLEEGSEDVYEWDEDSADPGSVDISCREDKVWDDYNDYDTAHSCVDKSLDEDLADDWELNVDGATKYRMDEIKSENLEDKSEVIIKTGEKGYCVELSLELEDVSKVTSTDGIDLSLEVLDDSSYANSRSPSILEIFYKGDGDRSTVELEKGEEETVNNVDVTEGSFEIGVVEDNDFNCGSTAQEISLNASIEEASCSGLGYTACNEAESCYYSREFNTCIEE